MTANCRLHRSGLLNWIYLIVFGLSIQYVGCYVKDPDAALDYVWDCQKDTHGILGVEDLELMLSWLPKQAANPDSICESRLSEGSYLCRNRHNHDYSDTCEGLWCMDHLRGQCTRVTSADGVICGEQKWCYEGKCKHSDLVEIRPETCPFGDTSTSNSAVSCDRIHTNRKLCYKESTERQCCQSCHDVRMNLEGCRFGDKMDGCDRQLCSLMDEHGLSLCCQTCAFMTKAILIPELPYTKIPNIDGTTHIPSGNTRERTTPGPNRTATGYTSTGTDRTSIVTDKPSTEQNRMSTTIKLTSRQIENTSKIPARTSIRSSTIPEVTSKPDRTTTKYTSTVPDKTSKGPHTTSTASGKVSKGPNRISTAPDKTSKEPQTTSTAPDKTTRGPDRTSTAPNNTYTGPHNTSTSPDSTSKEPHTTSTVTDKTSKEPHTTSTVPDKTSKEPHTTSTVPDKTTLGTGTDAAGTNQGSNTRSSQTATQSQTTNGRTQGGSDARRTSVASETSTARVAEQPTGTPANTGLQSSTESHAAGDTIALQSNASEIGMWVGIAVGAALLVSVVMVVFLLRRSRRAASTALTPSRRSRGSIEDEDGHSIGGDSSSALTGNLSGTSTTWYPNYMATHTME